MINKDIYGALYNWYTIQTGKLCPSGWHVPDLKEWKVIETFLGGPDVASGKMKAAGTDYWKNPNVGATNSSGFTGLPGGFRGDDGSFVYIRESNLLWTSTGNKSTSAWYRAQGYLAFDLAIGSNTVLWGDDSWGAEIHRQYRLTADKYEYSFRIRPVERDDDVVQLVKSPVF